MSTKASGISVQREIGVVGVTFTEPISLLHNVIIAYTAFHLKEKIISQLSSRNLKRSESLLKEMGICTKNIRHIHFHY